MNRPSAQRRPRLLRRFKVAAIVFLVLGLAGWLVREPITARMEGEVIRRLHAQDLYPTYTARSWLPWRGLRFTNAVLHRDSRLNHPVVEISELSVALPWTRILRSREIVTRWRTRDSRIALYDDAGKVSFEHVTGDVLVEGAKMEVHELRFTDDPVEWSLTGLLLVGVPTGPPEANRPFVVDLGIVRAVLAQLNFRPGTGQFSIQGTFNMDIRTPNPVWQAALEGHGHEAQWSGIFLREATVQAQLSDHGLHITPDLRLTEGTAKLDLSRTDWDRSPLVLRGQFADRDGRVDSIEGSHDFAGAKITVNTLSGPANLFAFGRNFPELAGYVPAGVRFRTFPEILARDMSWSLAGPAPAWLTGTVELKTPADLSVTIAGKAMKIERLAGRAARKDGAWQIDARTGPVSWQEWSAREMRVKGELGPAGPNINFGWNLAKGSIETTVTRDPRAPVDWRFSGKLKDSGGRVDEFAGRYDDAGQKTVVTRLEGKANLVELASNFPATAALVPKELRVRSFPDVAVKDFSYVMGRKSPGWTVDSVQARSGADFTLNFSAGSMAFDQVTGTAAYNGKGWRLEKVTGETMGGRFSLEGNYESGVLRDSTLALSKLRMEHLSPWLGSERATFGEGILSLDYRGTVAVDPRQITGSGVLTVDNAPLVKVPLLDETYALFSALSLSVKRTGTGKMKASFTANTGVFNIPDFGATSDSISVKAKGTLDLVRREVSAQAWGNLRGVAGLATLVLSRTLEMKVSGPLDQIRVQPAGPVKMAEGTVTGAAKAAGGALESGVKMPLKVFDRLKGDSAKP
jgi:hypothetical protein